MIGAGRAPRTLDPARVLADRRPAPVVLLEDPRDLGNMGACVRVAAAADVAGVLTTGTHDPWHPDALRGAAGLHFALPVVRLRRAGSSSTAPTGRCSRSTPTASRWTRRAAARAVLAFGTERHGLSAS